MKYFNTPNYELINCTIKSNVYHCNLSAPFIDSIRQRRKMHLKWSLRISSTLTVPVLKFK